MTIGLFHYLMLGSLLFCIGLFGVLTRRNAVAVLMSLELLFNSININMVAFARYVPEITGTVFSLFIIAVAAAEATVGVALVLSVYRNYQQIDLEKVSNLRA